MCEYRLIAWAHRRQERTRRRRSAQRPQSADEALLGQRVHRFSHASVAASASKAARSSQSVIDCASFWPRRRADRAAEARRAGVGAVTLKQPRTAISARPPRMAQLRRRLSPAALSQAAARWLVALLLYRCCRNAFHGRSQRRRTPRARAEFMWLFTPARCEVEFAAAAGAGRPAC